MAHNNKLKKLALLITFCYSSVTFSSEGVNPLECTDEEIAAYVDKSNITNRHNKMLVGYKEFEIAKNEVEIARIEASPNSSDLFKQDCWAMMGDSLKEEIQRQKDDIMDALESLDSFMSGGFDISSVISPAWDKIQEELDTMICESMMSASEFIAEAENDFVNIGKDKFYKEFNEAGLNIITDTNKMDSFLTNITRKELNDKEGLLKWKNGEIDTDYFNSKLEKTTGNQTDEKLKEEIEDLFDGI
jgi:hypothetical protein